MELDDSERICKQIREGVEMARAEGVKCGMPRGFTIEYEDGRKETYVCGEKDSS